MLQLKKIAVTIAGCSLDGKNIENFPKVTHLYIHIYETGLSTIFSILTFILKLDNIEELWVREVLRVTRQIPHNSSCFR